MVDTSTILLALFGGILPAFIWLLFWLKEDSKHPEPPKLIMLTFFYGMLAVPAALLVQIALNHFIIGDIGIEKAVKLTPIIGIIGVMVLAASEEIAKYIAAYNGGLKRDDDDEPIDDVIYMITAALGFAALENALFLFGPLLDGNTELAIVTGNMRFVGATLLHVSAAAIIGIFRAFSHFKLNEVKKKYLISGFIISIGLHTAFNLFIIINTELVFIAFGGVWILILGIIFTFEKLKSIYLEKIEKNV